MTQQQLLDAVNAAGITPEELTATLKGGALSVRRTRLGLKVRSAQQRGQRALAESEAEVQSLNAQIAALEAAQIAAIEAEG